MDLAEIIAQQVQAAVQDALASAMPGAPGNEVSKPATASKPATTRKPGTRKSAATVGKRKPASRKPASVPVGCITAGQAWVALGSDPNFEPRDHDKPASNGQLWGLNTAGKLALVS